MTSRSLFALFAAGLALSGCISTGAGPEGRRLKRMQRSPQWQEGRFVNALPRQDAARGQIIKKWLFGRNEHRTPTDPPPIVKRARHELATLPASGLRITWLGHSSTLIEIDGKRVLIDPVWGERVSPFSFAGPQRFHPPPLALEDLPPIDAVLISHDHYDHLDHPTIVALNQRRVRFVVPLGVGAHLEHWDVHPSRITELDWWEETALGDVILTATPARHFSGRSLTFGDRDRTLWAGWALRGPQHRVYYSGDTAMFPGFAEIGERLGPFDAALIETGAYDPLWRDVHLGPEQAAVAFEMVRGKLYIPVHWGSFSLAMHGWTEPVERVLAAAERLAIPVAVPRIGESIEPATPPPVARWWPDLPYDSPDHKPVFSSALPKELVARVQHAHGEAIAQEGTRVASEDHPSEDHQDVPPQSQAAEAGVAH